MFFCYVEFRKVLISNSLFYTLKERAHIEQERWSCPSFLNFSELFLSKFIFTLLLLLLNQIWHKASLSWWNVSRFVQLKGDAFVIPPQTKFEGYMVILMSVRSFVLLVVHPSQSLIPYSSNNAEQNFMKLSGNVHYMMPYCTSYFNSSLIECFWGFPEQNKDFAIQNMGERFVSFCEHCSPYF